MTKKKYKIYREIHAGLEIYIQVDIFGDRDSRTISTSTVSLDDSMLISSCW